MTATSPGRWVLAIVGFGTAVRLLVAAGTGLGVDESYMVGNARVWAWSTVDHPPLHVWIVAATRTLLGSESGFLLRVPFVGLGAASTWQMARLAADLYGLRAAPWAAALYTLAPVFGLSTSGFVLPDGPATFLSLVAARLLVPLVREGDVRWFAVGVAVGLAALSKVTAGFVAFGTFGFLVTTPTGRRTLATPGPWLAAAVAAAWFAPVVVWNLQHEGAGLAFQLARLHGPFRVGPWAANLAGQLVYLLPWIGLPLVACLADAVRQGPRDRRGWLLAWLAVGPVVFFGVAGGFARSFPHWPMAGWVFVVPMLAARLADVRSRWPLRIAVGTAVGTAALEVVAVGVLLVHARTGWLVPLVGGDPLRELLDWDEVPAALAARGLLDEGTVVAATHWTEAGKLRYSLGPDVPVVCVCDGPQRRSFAEAPVDVDVLWIGTPARLGDAPLDPVVVRRAGHPVLELRVRRGPIPR